MSLYLEVHRFYAINQLLTLFSLLVDLRYLQRYSLVNLALAIELATILGFLFYLYL